MTAGQGLAARVSAYVRRYPSLSLAAVVTAVDYAVTALLALLGRLTPAFSGYLVLMSVLTWFFAVVLPMANRAVRGRLGRPEISYWGGVTETCGRLVLFGQTALYTYLLVFALFRS